MSAKTIVGSSNIAILDSKILVDLCSGNFYIDLTPSTFIGTGESQMLGAKVRIVNPYNVVVKDFAAETYDIASPFTSVFQFGIPTRNSNYEYGEYTIDVEITDENGDTYTVSKTVNPCYPDINHKDRNYASLSASIKAVCKKGQVFVAVDNVPVYNGILNSGAVQSFTFEYPTNTLPSRTATLSYFADTLFEGVYKLNGNICANYNGADNISYKVNYKVKAEKRVYCQIDKCAILANFVQIHKDLDNDSCSEDTRLELSNKMVEALSLLETAELANECGEDASEYIERLEGLLGCKCSCGLAGTPIIEEDISGNVVIDGCNITKTVDGLTTHYTIDNYAYKIEVAPNGGYLTVSSPTINGCVSTQIISFDIAKVYGVIKTSANSNPTEQAFWASLINKALDGMDVTCLGTLGANWASKTLTQRLTAIKDAACKGWNYTPPTIPTIPDNVNGTVNRIAKFIGAKAVGDSQMVDDGTNVTLGTGFTAGKLSVETGTHNAGVYMGNVQATSDTQDLLAGWMQLRLTGAGLIQSNAHFFAAGFAVAYLQQTGNVTLLGASNAAHIASLVLSLSNGGTLNAPVLSAITASMGFTDDGHYDNLVGIHIPPASKVTYQGRPIFSGTIGKMGGLLIADRQAGGVVITDPYGVRQVGGGDRNWFAGKTMFGTPEGQPTSLIHARGDGHTQLRLENSFTPNGPSDARGAKGDHAWDSEYLYWKVEVTPGVLRWDRTRRDTTWVDPS